jgi:hypothetical protein
MTANTFGVATLVFGAKQRKFADQAQGQIPAGMNTKPGSRSARCCHTRLKFKSGPCCEVPTNRYRSVSAGVLMLQSTVKKVTNGESEADRGLI